MKAESPPPRAQLLVWWVVWAAILGGLTSPLGAVFGGVTLGLVESLAIVAVSSGYKDVIAMAILILIMIVMPQGLLGRRGRQGG